MVEKCWICRRTKKELLEEIMIEDKKEGLDNEVEIYEEEFKWEKQEVLSFIEHEITICQRCKELIEWISFKTSQDNGFISLEEFPKLIVKPEVD